MTKILKNTSWLVAGRAVSDGLGFLFYVVLARAFGESAMGDYAFAFSVAALFGLGVELGLTPLVTRSVARSRDAVHETLGTLLALQLAVSVALGSALLLLSALAGYPKELFVLLGLAFAAIALRALAMTLTACLEAIEAMDKSAMLDIIARGTVTVLGLGFIAAGASLQTVMLAHVLGSVAYTALAAYWLRRHFGRVEFRIRPEIVRGSLYAAAPFLASALLYELYARVDVIMLHNLAGEIETGRYAVALRLALTPLVVATLIGVAMYPALSRSAHLAVEERDGLFLRTLKWTALAGMAGAVVLLTVGGELLTALFGAEFSKAGTLVRWMGVIFFAEFVAVPYWRLLYALDREKAVLWLQGAAVGLNVVLNLALIPRWGALGAVWASITSEGLLAVAFHFLCRRVISARYGNMGMRLLAAGMGAIGVGVLVLPAVPWPVAGGLSLAVLMVLSAATRIVTRRDYEGLAAAVSGRSVRAL